MKQLFILYDAQCELCCRIRVWLGRQPAYLPLVWLPLQAEEVGCRFPGIERLRPHEQLLVINDQGEVWSGERAWITVLWALREYRPWAMRLAAPALRPFARRVCEAVSRNRHLISRWMQRETHNALREKLACLPDAPSCYEGYCKPR